MLELVLGMLVGGSIFTSEEWMAERKKMLIFVESMVGEKGMARECLGRDGEEKFGIC